MVSIKKTISQKELGNIKVTKEGFKEKSKEEIMNKQNSQNQNSSGVIDVELSSYYTKQKPQISINRKAHAPYNFIPLDNKIVFSKFDINNEECQFDKYHTNKNTGYIKINIETKTPVYLRDTINSCENSQGRVSKNISDFFSPGDDVLKLSGSTLRGLTRTLVEIISWGKFVNFQDKRLYMRGFADRTLGAVYKNYGLSSFSRASGVSYNMNCGLLIKKGQNYFIKDCGKAKQIPKTAAMTRVSALRLTYNLFNFYDETSAKEYIVVSGDISGKNNDWIVKYPASTCTEIPLSDKDIDDYIADINRDEKTNLLKKLEVHPSGVPCFYTNWIDDNGTTRYVFGHTGMFRVPYNKTIGQHVPKEFQSNNSIDLAEAIFGNEKTFAGRVFFEDSVCTEKDKSKVLLGENHPQNLSSPKATTFQHYLTQPEEEQNNLKHYGPDTANKLSIIRGYKQYWHRDETNWTASSSDVKKYPNQYDTKINPVKAGTTFTGRIRFENLSDIELGALLFALDLPIEKDASGIITTECCHKIGMGKPLGLGSIRINPTLYLSNRKNRYTNISEEWSSPIQESIDERTNISHFKNAFATYIINVLNYDKNNYSYGDLWKVDRLNELKIMLDFKKKPDNSKTRYMTIQPNNEFRNRPVLPKPSDVK